VRNAGREVDGLAGLCVPVGLAGDADADPAALDRHGLGLEVVHVHRRARARVDAAGHLEALAAFVVRDAVERHPAAVAVVDRVGVRGQWEPFATMSIETESSVYAH
jgi:hypothetical protein